MHVLEPGFTWVQSIAVVFVPESVAGFPCPTSRDEIDDFLEDTRTYIPDDVTTQLVVREGRTSQAIIDRVTVAGHDCIVLGAPCGGRARAYDAAARQLSRDSPVPVILVR